MEYVFFRPCKPLVAIFKGVCLQSIISHENVVENLGQNLKSGGLTVRYYFKSDALTLRQNFKSDALTLGHET